MSEQEFKGRFEMSKKSESIQEMIWEIKWWLFHLNNRIMAAAFNWLGRKLIRRYGCGDEACLTCKVGAAHDDLPILSEAFNMGYDVGFDAKGK
jgi:hypothetical protein